MSTILKALKQAEKSKPVQGYESRPSFNAQARLRFQAEQKRKSLFLNPGQIVGVVVLIVLVIFLYSIFPVNKTTKLQTSSAAKQSQVLAIKPENVKNKNQVFPEPVPEFPRLSDTSTKTLPKPADKSFDLSILQNEPGLKPELANKLPVGDTYPNSAKEKSNRPFDTRLSKKIKKRTPIKATGKPKTTPGTKRPLITEEAASPTLEMNDPIQDIKEPLTPNTPNRKMTALKNDDLKIQAISWAQEPENRIAVIDNRVLRQGDAVQGYRLVEIEKDSVILQYSGKNYRLGFKYR